MDHITSSRLIEAGSDLIRRQLAELRIEHTRLAADRDRLHNEVKQLKAVRSDTQQLESLPAMACVLDHDGGLLFVNQHWTNATGFTIDGQNARSWLEHIHPLDRPIVQAKLTAISQRQAPDRTEFRLLHRDGTYQWIVLSLQPRRDGKGKFTEAVGVAQDVTRRHETEDRLQLVIEGAGLGTWDLQLNSSELTVNDIWARLLGYKKGDLEPTLAQWRDLIHQEDQEDVLTALRQHTQGKTVAFDHIFRMHHQQGGLKWVHVIGRIVSWSTKGHPRRAAGIMFDITEQVEAKTEREQISQKMMEAQRLEMVGRLAGGVAHEFNNFLMGILGNAELLRACVPEQNPSYRHLDAIARSSSRAADLCHALLAYSGKGQLMAEPVNLNKTLDNLLDLIRISIPSCIQLTCQSEPSLPAIEADNTQIRLVITNLIINAADAIGDQDGQIQIQTSSAYLTDDVLRTDYRAIDLVSGRYVILDVTDDGGGMDEETLARLFEPFFTTKSKSHGLGMAAVLGIINSHQGAITVESTPGAGTHVRILLPTTELEPQDPNQANQDNAIQRKTILVIEDEEIVRDLTKMVLEHNGMRVITAVDGIDGLRSFEKNANQIALVLLDLAMPRMAGDEVIRSIDLIDPSIPIILTSGYPEAECVDPEIRSRINGFIQKPYQSEQLLEQLRRALGNP